MPESNSYADTVWEELLTAIEHRSEKLAELDLQPLRFRQRSAAGDNPLPQPE
jgi:hypothetical protein